MFHQGVLTETTAELAASLSLAAARRIVEADEFMRAGLYDGWLPHLYEIHSLCSILLTCFLYHLLHVFTTLKEITQIIYSHCRFVGNLLKGQTVGVIGAGRIGSAYARMMVINLVFIPPDINKALFSNTGF